jgi:trimethylamine--corrinoid protein Co-methyltransferase
MQLTMFPEPAIQAVQDASLKILSEVGIELKEPAGIEILTGAGAQLHREGGKTRLTLPPELVMHAVGLCPNQVTLFGRDGKQVVLGGGSLHWHNLGGARDVYDHRSSSRRPAVVEDVRSAARLLDALPEASSITPFFTPQDVPGAIMSLAMYRHSLPNTTKPLHGPGVQNRREVDYAVRMAQVIGDPQWLLSLSVSPVSPLTFPDPAVQAIIQIAHCGIPFAPLPCPTAGTTAPFSIAGALAQQNAEVLASIVLAQLVHPGLPVVYCGRLAMMEPRTGVSVWGGVELALASAVTVQVAHAYGLPVNVYGFSTNAHILDVQNGAERALNAAIPALAGADELSGIGEMEAGVMGSFAQMVVDAEIAASIQRLKRSFAITPDSLAVDVIADVMLSGGSFLVQQHTVKYLRQGETLVTRLAERAGWESWERGGRQSMAERAQDLAEHILDTHQVPALDGAQEQALDELLAGAEKDMESAT